MRIISSGSIEGRHVAVVGRQVSAYARQIDEPVDPTQQVIPRNVPLDAEADEQGLLHHRPFAHHRLNPSLTDQSESAPPTPRNAGVFQH